MRFFLKPILLLVLSLSAGLSAPAGLSGLSSMPDGSEVRILRDELQSVLSSGTVRSKVLTLTTPGGRLPPYVRVKVWIGVSEKGNADLLSFSGSTAESGMDVLLEDDGGRVSFVQVMREVYNIRVEFKDGKK